jgi:hypothetical protein
MVPTLNLAPYIQYGFVLIMPLITTGDATFRMAHKIKNMGFTMT